MSEQQLLRRLPDWPERLARHYSVHAAVRFALGSADCVSFAAGAVLAATGVDVAAGMLGHGPRRALRLLRDVGGLRGAVSRVLPPLPGLTMAWRGDVVLVAPGGSRRAWLAVCDGHRWIALSAAGLVQGPMESARCAWGVGHG